MRYPPRPDMGEIDDLVIPAREPWEQDAADVETVGIISVLVLAVAFMAGFAAGALTMWVMT